MEKIKTRVEAFCSRFRIDKKLLFFIVIGFIGIFLLVLSECIPQDEKTAEEGEQNL